MLKPVKIISIDENTNPKFVKTELVTAERDGVSFKWERIKSHDSVHIVVYNVTTREFLLVNQVRVPVLCSDNSNNGIVTECAAGLVDKDIPIAQIAQEEILEELGYDVPLSKVIPIKVLKSSVGTAGTTSHTYYAEVTESMRVSDGGGLEGEDIEVVRISIDNVYDWLFSPDTTTDAVTMFLVTWYHSMLIDE